MSERKELLGLILICSQQLESFKNVELTKKEAELISKIREELTKLAGPEDIMSVKIIKKQIFENDSIRRGEEDYEAARNMLDRNLTAPNKEDKGIISDVCTEIINAIKYIESTYN